MNTRDFNDLVNKDYQVCYLDPPWLHTGSPTKDQAAGKHYACLSPDQLAAIPVGDILAKKAVMLMWTTSSKMAVAVDLLRAYGMHYRGVHQVWVKTTLAGKIIHGQGVRPSFVKPTCEYLLIGSTQATGRTFPLLTENMPNAVLAARPGNEHSRKPAVFRTNITDLWGDLKRVELFARGAGHSGWDSWGNEIVEDKCP